MLRVQLAELELSLLPATPDPLGNYPHEQIVRTRAYIVLAHATFEHFIEKACRARAQAAKTAFLAGNPSRAAASMLAHYVAPSFPADINRTSKTEIDRLDLNLQIEAALAAYESQIDDNNGIKKHNLIRLLAPLGFAWASLSATDLATCDSFGETRGLLAHGRVHNVIDPFSEKQTVDKVEVFMASIATQVAALG